MKQKSFKFETDVSETYKNECFIFLSVRREAG
jgi:hypothetical protein